MKSALGLAIALAMIANPAIASPEKITQFICDISPEGLPQLKVIPSDNVTTVLIEFVTKYFSKYTPKARCDEIAERANRLYSQGMLKYWVAGEVNNYPVVCGVAKVGDPCTEENVFITLRPKVDDSEEFVQQLDEDFTEARGGGPIRHYQEQISYEYGGKTYIRISDVIAAARRKRANGQ